jgi:gas vesicle protein
MSRDGSEKFLWLMAGAAVGTAVAMLLAPRSGPDTRSLIAGKASEGRHKFAEGRRELFERGRELYEKGRQIADEAADLFEQGRRIVEEPRAGLQ